MKYYQSIIQAIESNIQRLPNKTAYIIGDERVTYTQMNEMAERVASYIISHLKTEALESDRNVRVVINLPRNSHYVPCILAAVKLGCSYVPIDVAGPTY